MRCSGTVSRLPQRIRLALGRRPAWPVVVLSLSGWGLAGGLAGCTDVGGKPPLPSGIPDQQALKTVAGARQLYNGALATFGNGTINGGGSWGALLWSVLEQGLLSDELTVNSGGGSPLDYLQLESFDGAPGAPVATYALDSHNLPEGGGGTGDTAYAALQTLRARAAEGIGALAQYDTTAASKALRGHLYALTGYAELYLADLFCSGVPLSTFDYNADFTYKAGSSTDSIYADAKRQFQAAVPLLTDSVSWLNLARVGLGRAFLNLGLYDSAAAAVQAVRSDFVYQVPVNWSNSAGGGPLLIAFNAMMADMEGGIGPAYRSSGDPRTRGLFVGQFVATLGNNLLFTGDSMFIPAKYGDGTGTVPITVASGLEARLIWAEAALHPHNVAVPSASASDVGAMLDTLNAMRTDSGLPPLDPSTVSASSAVDTLFAERAAWLYLDGHRLGDLRRLLRHYNRLLGTVVPTGPYWVPVPQYPNYGRDVELPIPAAEQQINPFFTGCLRRGI